MFGDCHIHMILDGVYYRAAIDAQKECVNEALVRSRLEAYGAAGIHFLRDGGDAWGVGSFAARVAAEYGIDYRTPAFPIHKKGRYGGFIGCGFENMKEYAQLVRRAADAGADFIKIMISGLMDFSHFGVITSQPLSALEIKEMIHIAHSEGFAVMAHANGAETIKTAIAAGVDSIEHGAYLDDEAVQAVAQSGCVWVPTLVTIGNLVGEGRFSDEVLKPLLRLQMENVQKCAKMKGHIALGSDNGAYCVPHVQGTLDEYNLLKAAMGQETDRVLEYGEAIIKKRFGRGEI